MWYIKKYKCYGKHKPEEGVVVYVCGVMVVVGMEKSKFYIRWSGKPDLGVKT